MIDSEQGALQVESGAPAPPAAAVATSTRPERGILHGRFAGLLGDLVAFTAAEAVAIVTTLPVSNATGLGDAGVVMWAALLGLFWLAVCAGHGHYRRTEVRISGASAEATFRDIIRPLAIGLATLFMLQGVVNGAAGFEVLSPAGQAIFAALALLLVTASRLSLRTLAPSLRRPQRTLFVGSGEVVTLLEQKMRAHREYCLEPIGFLDDDVEAGGTLPRLGGCLDLAEVVERERIDRVFMAFSRAPVEQALAMTRSIRNPAVQISIVPRYFEVFPARATVDDFEEIPMITLPPVRMGRGARFTKRVFDVAIAGTMLVFLSPVLAAVTAAVRLNSAGPAIFRQARRGRNGGTFYIAKFRTMYQDAESRKKDLEQFNDVDGPLFKMKENDPRVTSVGRFLRRTSLDELPQLWNVVRGDMSLVGPRPFVLTEADQITGWASRRLDMTPGITGLWQAMGRNDLSYEEMKRLDYLYVTNWSLWWDIKILARTARVVLARRGAY
ncbi:MAG: sugar transferase [Thermoleophilia bacterium]